MSERMITVLDFTKHEVRTITPEQARAELNLLCRRARHYFTSRWPHKPLPHQRCVCGDITFAEWRAQPSAEDGGEPVRVQP